MWSFFGVLEHESLEVVLDGLAGPGLIDLLEAVEVVIAVDVDQVEVGPAGLVSGLLEPLVQDRVVALDSVWPRRRRGGCAR